MTDDPSPADSKVLNGRSGVSEDTRARIEALIACHGYRKPPNRSNTVELLFRELASMWAVEIIRGVEQVARRTRVGLEELPQTGVEIATTLTVRGSTARPQGQW